jgi:hypothetical protein
MSIESPKGTHGVSLQRSSATPSFEGGVTRPQAPVLQQIKPEPVDYSTLPRSQSVQGSQNFQISDKDISNLVNSVLMQQQKPVPTGLSAKDTPNDLQAGIVQNLKQNNYPVPSALR